MVQGTGNSSPSVVSLDQRGKVERAAAEASYGENWEDGGASVDVMEFADGFCAIAEECETEKD